MDGPTDWRISRPVPIIPGESLDGYVSRVAATHHFPRMAEITQIGGAEANGRPHASFLDDAGIVAIAEYLGVDADLLKHHAPTLSPDSRRRNMFGVELAADYLQFAYRRFSPSALAVSPHHRALWNLRLFPFCTETWEFLEERCPHPACRRQQRWRRTLGIDLCDFCGEPLTRAVAETVAIELRQNLEHLVDLVHPDAARRDRVRRKLPSVLRKVEADDLLTLATLLAAVLVPTAAHPISSANLCLEKAKTFAVPALSAAWPLLEGWPGAFEDLLVDRINRYSSGRGDGNFGASHRFLLKCRRRELSPALRKLIDDFNDNCRSAPQRALTGQQAANLVGSRVSTLVQMRRAGELKSVLCLEGHRFHVLFDRASIEQLADRFKPRIRRERLAARLGVPTYAVRDLVNRGLLHTAPVPPGRTRRLSVFADSAEALLTALAEKMPARNSDYPVKLTKLMYCLGGGPKPWGAVLAAILDGTLDAALEPGSHRVVERIFLRSTKVITLPVFSDSPELDPRDTSIPKADLADMMSLSRTNFSRYSEYLLGPGGHFLDICPHKALSIANTMISTTEIAARLQIHHTDAFRSATQRGVAVKSEGLFDRASAFDLMPELDDILRDACGRMVQPTCATKDSRRLSFASVSPDGRFKMPKLIARSLDLDDGGRILFEICDAGVLVRRAE